MDPKELRGLYEAYSEVYAPQEVDEAYQEPKLDRKAFVKHANRRSGFSLGTREDPHGWREPGMENVAKEYAARTSSARRAKRTGQPDAYKASKEAQSKFKKEELEIFDIVLEFLQAEGYAETLEEAEWLMANVIDEEAIEIITELTGGKGHPGYKSGSRDHGPMQSGHPADTEKRKDKGGTMSMRHGYHLGDIDDKDDDDSDLEPIVKQQSRDSRERTRKPLRDKVRAARKVLSKEEYVDEAEKPFPHEKVKAKQVALRSQGGNALDRRMKMGLAVRRAKEAEKTGGSQKDAGAGWYHAKEEYVDEAEKPFPYDKVTAQQKKHTAAGRYGNMMKMGLAKRRAKEAEKTGGSQRDAGAGWYHAKEEYVDEGHGSRRSFKKQSEDERWRVKTFKSDFYTPHKNYDPEANRGQGQILRPNQAEKQRRKALAKSAVTKEDFESWLDEAMSSYDKARKQAARRAEERNRLRAAGKMRGPMERISLRDKFGDEAGTRMGKANPPGPGEKY